MEGIRGPVGLPQKADLPAESAAFVSGSSSPAGISGAIQKVRVDGLSSSRAEALPSCASVRIYSIALSSLWPEILALSTAVPARRSSPRQVTGRIIRASSNSIKVLHNTICWELV